MTTPEIIGSTRSTYTHAIRLVCEEKRIDYKLTECPLRAPELYAIHPFGKMPVLRHGDFELFESKAIAGYLDRSFPAPYLFPDDLRLAALTEQWISLVNTLMDHTLIRTYLFAYIAPNTADGGPDRATIDAIMPALQAQIEDGLRLLHRQPDRAVGADAVTRIVDQRQHVLDVAGRPVA